MHHKAWHRPAFFDVGTCIWKHKIRGHYVLMCFSCGISPTILPSPLLLCFLFYFCLILKALPRQWVALETTILQSLRSRMLTSVSPFFLISLLMVSLYPNFGLPLGLTPSTSMSNTVLVIWLSSLRLTCPYQRSRFCIRCVAIG